MIAPEITQFYLRDILRTDQESASVYDIIDEAGGIAAIATILASGSINIKNIGIVHNREFEEGVLRIEFCEEAPRKKR